MGLAKRIAKKIIDALLGALNDILGGAFDWVVGKLAGAVGLLVTPVGELMVFAPTPRPIGQLGQRPTNSPWGTLYDAFWADMVPLALLILLVSYLIRQAAATFGIGNVAGQRQNQRGVVIGLVLIPSSWYLAMLLLQLFNALTRALAPNMTNLSGILNQVAASGNGLSALFAAVLMLSASATVYALVLLLNVIRIAGVFTLVYALPVLIAFDLGQFPYVGEISRRLLALLPTLAFLPLPTAIGLRLSLLVFGQNGGLQIEGLPASPLLNSIFLLAPGLLGIAVPFLVFRTAPFGQRLSAMGGFSTNNNLQRARNAADGRSFRPTFGSVRRRLGRTSESAPKDETDETASTTTDRSQTGGLPTRTPSRHDRPALPDPTTERVSTDGGGSGSRRRGRTTVDGRRPSFIATTDGYVVETHSPDAERDASSGSKRNVPIGSSDGAAGTSDTASSRAESSETTAPNDGAVLASDSEPKLTTPRRTTDRSRGAAELDRRRDGDDNPGDTSDSSGPDLENRRQSSPAHVDTESTPDQMEGGHTGPGSTETADTPPSGDTTDSTSRATASTTEHTETELTATPADESENPAEHVDDEAPSADGSAAKHHPESPATNRRTPSGTDRDETTSADDDTTGSSDTDDEDEDDV